MATNIYYYSIIASVQGPNDEYFRNIYWVMRANSSRRLKECFRNYNPTDEEISETLTEEQQSEAVMGFATGSR